MGGWGSGWHRPVKWKADRMAKVNVCAVHPWPADEPPPASVPVVVEWYDGTRFSTGIELVHDLRAGYRGTRPAFLCPRCRRVRVVLYVGHPELCPTSTGEPVIGCRACLPIFYRSQTESRRRRREGIVHRMEAALQVEREARGVVAHDKPRYWRWARYARWVKTHDRAARAWLADFIADGERFARRVGARRGKGR